MEKYFHRISSLFGNIWVSKILASTCRQSQKERRTFSSLSFLTSTWKQLHWGRENCLPILLKRSRWWPYLTFWHQYHGYSTHHPQSQKSSSKSHYSSAQMRLRNYNSLYFCCFHFPEVHKFSVTDAYIDHVATKCDSICQNHRPNSCR